MAEEEKIDPGHVATRCVLRVVGPTMLAAGGALLVVALVNFFMAFGSAEPPRLFWCAFIGVPLLGLGGAVTKFAFMGAVGRYVAGEAAPVAKDTFNYMAEGTEDGLRNVGRAVGEGLRGDGTAGETIQVRCRKCNTLNDADARFCDECGTPLQKTVECPGCGEMNDPDARFCDNCGHRLG